MGIITQHTTKQYHEALLALLPHGQIWDDERANPQGELYQLCEIWAHDFHLMERELANLFSEASPLTAQHTLDIWQQSAGITAHDAAYTDNALRLQIWQDLAGSHTLSYDGFQFACTMLGLTGSIMPIQEGMPAICGIYECGEPLYDGGVNVRYYITLSVKDAAMRMELEQNSSALCGDYRCGSPLYSENYQDIIARKYDEHMRERALIERILPAHVQPIYRYEL